VNTAFTAFRKDGFEPEQLVVTTPVPLDGREAVVRNRPSNLTSLILDGMLREAGGADAAILNGGSIRIDDVLPAGVVRQYDVIRILPFGGKILKARLGGALLVQLLDAGLANAGTGGFLQTSGITRVAGPWLVAGKPIDPDASYTVALPEFLLSGGEGRMGFLTRTNPQVRDVQEFGDIRQAVIAELRARFPAK
jgi:5'-nucleotidase / UDP-sugar diphosphatase